VRLAWHSRQIIKKNPFCDRNHWQSPRPILKTGSQDRMVSEVWIKSNLHKPNRMYSLHCRQIIKTNPWRNRSHLQNPRPISMTRSQDRVVSEVWIRSTVYKPNLARTKTKKLVRIPSGQKALSHQCNACNTQCNS